MGIYMHWVVIRNVNWVIGQPQKDAVGFNLVIPPQQEQFFQIYAGYLQMNMMTIMLQ